MANGDKPKPYTGEIVTVDPGKPKPYTGDIISPDQSSGNLPTDAPDVSATTRPADARPFRPIAEDVLTRMASSLSFGTAEKASAAINAARGNGTYEENLVKNRAATEEAGKRLGLPGMILADLSGGVLTGGALRSLGLTLLGRLGPEASTAQKILAGAGEGFGYGAAQGAGHTDTGQLQDYVNNALKSGGWGALVGGVIPAVVGGAQKVITPNPITDPERAAQNAILEAAGVNTSAAQRIASPNLRMSEDAAAKLPMGWDPAAGQMGKVTQAMMEKAGIGGGGMPTGPVLKAGFDTVGRKIGSIQDKYAINVDNDLLNTAARVESDMKPLVPEGSQKAVQMFVDKLTNSQQLTPEMAKSIRTQLNQAIKGENGPSGNPNYRDALVELKEGLDSALERSIGTSAGPNAAAEIAQLNLARRQYANLHVLTDALAHSGEGGLRGTLTPTALAAALKRNVGQQSFMLGAGDANDLARASAGLLKPSDSGTATREGMTNPMKWVMSPILNAAINSRSPFGGMQRYLSNQAMPTRVPPGLLQGPVAGGAAATAPPGGLLDQMWRGLGMAPPAGP